MTWRSIGLVLSSLTLLGCAGSIRPQALQPDHPASAEAPEAPTEAPPLTLRGRPPVLPPAGEADPSDPHRHHQPASGDVERTQVPRKESSTEEIVIYTCPMHAEVHEPVPGHCPKCGMKLIREREK